MTGQDGKQTEISYGLADGKETVTVHDSQGDKQITLDMGEVSKITAGGSTITPTWMSLMSGDNFAGNVPQKISYRDGNQTTTTFTYKPVPDRGFEVATADVG
ncbi:hypothetical protein [Streptomyces sp. NRRL F-2664]|uniref:hypothetical protein n=1 Tax=Streptomyces sp. NRRL F-2664 TaxID=1463842 RepID=UPI0004CB6ECC|nr:hypothetical protein [Streptomyces sp. NRRL F-2664]